MLRWTSVLPFCTVGAFLLLQAPIQAQQTSDSHLPVSLERIRAALEEPPPIEQTPPPPIDRQRRGTIYVRVLAAVGIGLTVLFLWQVLTKF